MAITAILQAQQILQAQAEQIEADKQAIAKDIEQRLRLSAGALNSDGTHRVNVEEWKVEPIPAGSS